jgi:hypothetical protein
MATTRQAITRAWTAVIADEASVNLCNPSPWMMEYCVETSEPAATDVGVRLPGGFTHPVAVAAGEDLYARIVTDAGAENAVVIAIDA